MGPRAWNEPPRADQLTPLPPPISLAHQPHQEILRVQGLWSLFNRFFFVILGHAAADLTSPVKTPKCGNVRSTPPPGPLRPAMYSPCDWGCCTYAPEALLAAGDAKTRHFLCFLDLNTRSTEVANAWQLVTQGVTSVWIACPTARRVTRDHRPGTRVPELPREFWNRQLWFQSSNGRRIFLVASALRN
jgi:hypothetical protein